LNQRIPFVILLQLLFVWSAYASKAESCYSTFDVAKVFFDKEGAVKIDDLLNENQQIIFEEQKLNFGYNKKFVWIKFEFKEIDCTKNTPLVVTFSHPIINQIDFYHTRNDSVLKSSSTGTLKPISSREFVNSKFSFYIDDFTSDDFVYVRLKNNISALKSRIIVSDVFTFQKKSFYKNGFIFLFLGCFLIHFLFAAVQYYILNKDIFFRYGLLIIAIIFNQSLNYGILQLFLPEFSLPVVDYLRVASSPLVVFFLILFGFSLLDVKELFSKKAIQVFYFIMAFQLVYCFIVLFIPSSTSLFNLLVYLYYLVTVFSIVHLLYISYMSGSKGHKPGYYFLWVQSPIAIGMAIYIMRNLAIIDDYQHLEFYYPVFLLYEAFVSIIILTIYYHRLNFATSGNISVENIEERFVEISQKDKEVFKQLNQLFVKEKTYLNSNLKIADVADKLNITKHELSKIINNCSQMHFFDFVNLYRVNHAKKLLRDHEVVEKYTIESIAHQSGFNNRVTFSNAFKKLTDLTPSEYKDL
jgi:AraC-like DNA-binding protein